MHNVVWAEHYHKNKQEKELSDKTQGSKHVELTATSPNILINNLVSILFVCLKPLLPCQ